MTKMSSTSIHGAGVDAVCAALCGRNVTIKCGRDKGGYFDVLATGNGRSSVGIAVRASLRSYHPYYWYIGSKPPMASVTFFYVLVNLWEDRTKASELYVVPSAVVAEKASSGRQQPKVNLGKDADRYRDNWQIIINALK